MRVLQVCLLVALCGTIKAGYVSYANYGGHPVYIGHSYGGHGDHVYDGHGNAGHGYVGHGYVGHGYDGYRNQVEYYAYPQYAYDYSVKDPHTGDFKTKWETRDGDVVKGAYSVAEPDGTTRIVEYTADSHNGFNAVVKRIGHAYHPQAYNNYHSGYHTYQ